MAEKMKRCKPNEQRFCAIYCRNGRNGTQAYSEVYPRASRGSCATKACEWLNKDYIIAEIERITNVALKREHMKADEVLTEWSRISRSNIKELVWQPGEMNSQGQETVPGTRKPIHELPDHVARAIKSYKLKDGDVEIAWWDKNNSLDKLGKVHGLAPDNKNINVRMTLEELIGGVDNNGD
jgi:hypothetical protein